MRTIEEIAKERKSLVRQWQALNGRTDPEAKQKMEELGARSNETEKEIEALREAASEAPRFFMLKPREHKKEGDRRWLAVASGILVTVFVVFLLTIILKRADTGVKWRGPIERSPRTYLAVTPYVLALAPQAVGKASATPAVSSTAPAPPKGLRVVAASEIPEVAIIRKGEGIEHAFIRQLIVDPARKIIIVDREGRTFDLSFSGHLNDKNAVRKWAETTAGVISYRCGYVDAKGNEVRVKAPNVVAYLLQADNDGNVIGVKECPKDKDGQFQTAPELTHFQKFAKNFGDIKFKGSDPKNLGSYEYPHTKV